MIVYNRVGKCGSSSILQLLRQNCHVTEAKLPHPFNVNNESVNTLKAIVETAQKKPVTRKCNVVVGHFLYIPLENVKYMNILCNPVKRWMSLHNFYLHSPIPFKRSKISLEYCPYTTNITRKCVGAEDSHITDYFGTTNYEDIFHRYAFLETLEDVREDLSSLYTFLIQKPIKRKLYNINNTTNKVYFNQSIMKTLQTELQDDINLWYYVYMKKHKGCVLATYWPYRNYSCITDAMFSISENIRWRLVDAQRPRCWSHSHEGLIIC